MSEHIPPFTPEERPNFYDLQDNAEAGIVKRGLARYFFTRNYERSIKIHNIIGSPLMRKAIMGVFGRFAPPGTGGNYRLDNSKSRIEAATTFATSGSIINEVVHTVAAMPTGIIATTSIAEGRYGADVLFNVAITGLNLGLVALQRYNRARMIKRVDEELAQGATFRPDYTNWLGIDAWAVENYREALDRQCGGPTPAHQLGDIDAALQRPEMH